jgi:protein-tyrosine phosphatase
LSATGFIDVHSHLLPGIDDGCRSLDDSLACVETLIRHGFTGTVCTPHMAVWQFPANTPAHVADLVAALQEQLDRAGLEYRLWAGGEVRIGEGTVSWFEEHGVPTLGASRCVLIDYWGRSWPACGDRVIEFLFDLGYQPILAHPERMDFEDREWRTILDRLDRAGVRLQGNLKCLAGREGPKTLDRACRLLRANRYDLLATDMHRPDDLDDRLAGLEIVRDETGSAGQMSLLRDRPSEVILPERTRGDG